jgi:hypothetical protein
MKQTNTKWCIEKYVISPAKEMDIFKMDYFFISEVADFKFSDCIVPNICKDFQFGSLLSQN